MIKKSCDKITKAFKNVAIRDCDQCRVQYYQNDIKSRIYIYISYTFIIYLEAQGGKIKTLKVF